MQIESINAGLVETISHRRKSMTTGICKRPLDGSVQITREGIPGDAIVATQHHGGPDQAIYAYSADDYGWWAANSSHEFFPGLFGENLTIHDMPSDMRVGDRLLIGEVVLEATAPRIPCDTFSTRMQDQGFGLAFRNAERPGIYFRVLNEGQVEVGDTVTYVESAETDVGIVELFRVYYELSPDPAKLRRVLEAPIAERLRERFEKKLVKTSA
ncbi:MAG: MOSC domain-containing protein [Gammaproteobacteria bacterium]|nr:MOSC domain-containing protein [Gammaproteobacteria bacterium]MBT8105777.1 MOSC domain-containing protein [Gammaproteobacteria bacterium]NNF48989.1 MOSC domain-containing protein [Woeseiaceae bacterium]NNK25791.1 MOSC domain-containing protein [Woeseiaceae bacterium]NNL63033.1 MOSC domain-containing protein [Woeseiaceae bacterium]